MVDLSRSTPGDLERRAQIKREGLAALGRLKNNETYENWRAAGEALLVITEDTLDAMNLPRDGWTSDNPKLSREFTKRFEAWELSGPSSNQQKPITKQERWALREIMTNPTYHAWYTTLDGPTRRRLNHPNAIINKYKASTRVPSIPDGEKPPSKAKQTEHALAKAEQELHALKERQKRDGSLFDLWNDKPDDITNVIVGTVSPGSFEDLMESLLGAVSPDRIDAILKRVKAKAKRKQQKHAG